ncbi:ribosomal large subunit pseudouridylate synthase, putative [Plasmodium reichenowi]|uniref:Ribosomal large subunit pseudouridylate synthase, putative n=1 Tax=Plasmodium reichenowi TaxID=5854 RepID=A0A2P9D7D3_PLARE|nr:ribosomal large subunit pseudouridylate synthase, putative [Plasmodium reichenowi]
MIFRRLIYHTSKRSKEKNTFFAFLKKQKYKTVRNYNMKEEKKEYEAFQNHVTTPLYKSYKGHDLKIIYENDYFLVLNKPYDIKLEKGKLDDIYPSVETLLYQKRKLDVFRICGQLDYATSGLLIVAKDKLSCNILNYNIESKNISKIYLAILYGHLPLDILHINTPISKNKEGFKMKLCYNYNDYYDNGKYCYSLIYPYKHSYINNEKVTLCEMRTVTGRRHQLRLHSLSLGSSIVGDETYFDDMITNKYKIEYNNVNGKNENEKDIQIKENDNNNNNNYDNRYDGILLCNEKKKKIHVERMMLHCWIILKNKEFNNLKKSENINNLEKQIFDQDYIICEDELSQFANENSRTFEDCVLKNNDLINTSFINYNLKGIKKNIKNIDRKLKNNLNNKRDITRHINMSFNNSDNMKITKNNNITKYEQHPNNDVLLNLNKAPIINVTDNFLNYENVNKNNIYEIKNDKYKNPNDLFDDIHDTYNKFNWG